MARYHTWLNILFCLSACSTGQQITEAPWMQPMASTSPSTVSLAPPPQTRATSPNVASESPQGVPMVDAEVASSSRSNLQWKRAPALSADLARALDLPAEELCKEFGLASCVDTVHLVTLGGNDPFDQGLWVPAKEPLATTSIAVDRLVLKACDRRAELDEQALPEQRVMPLDDYKAAAPAPESQALSKLVTQLYRRMLGRDPDAPEVAVIADLARSSAGQAVSGATLVRSVCYAVGTTAEFMFF